MRNTVCASSRAAPRSYVGARLERAGHAGDRSPPPSCRGAAARRRAPGSRRSSPARRLNGGSGARGGRLARAPAQQHFAIERGQRRRRARQPLAQPRVELVARHDVRQHQRRRRPRQATISIVRAAPPRRPGTGRSRRCGARRGRPTATAARSRVRIAFRSGTRTRRVARGVITGSVLRDQPLEFGAGTFAEREGAGGGGRGIPRDAMSVDDTAFMRSSAACRAMCSAAASRPWTACASAGGVTAISSRCARRARSESGRRNRASGPDSSRMLSSHLRNCASRGSARRSNRDIP